MIWIQYFPVVRSWDIVNRIESWRHVYLPLRTTARHLFSICSCVCLLVTFFHLNKFVLLANWRNLLLQTLSLFIPSKILFTVLLTNLSFGYFDLFWWRRVWTSMVLGVVALHQSPISEFLECFHVFWVVRGFNFTSVAYF